MVTTPDCVAGFFLQQLPDSRSALERQMNEQAREEDWNRINVLAATVDSGELLGLQPETLLFRLFHEEQLLLHAPKDLHFSCTCSREKVERTLLTIGRAEADDILRTDGKIEVDCEFCQERYLFNATDVEALFDTADKSELPPGSIVH
jgi:molecular chaperone Hsp33